MLIIFNNKAGNKEFSANQIVGKVQSRFKNLEKKDTCIIVVKKISGKLRSNTL